MAVAFRNVELGQGTPLEHWPYEALVTVIERGTVGDWARLTRAIRREPWGEVARQVEEYLGQAQPWGVGPLLQRAVDAARAEAERSERETVARHVTDLIARSGLSQAEFAQRIGTSASRLSTYRTGAVVPSAALVVRMELLSARLSGVAADRLG
ncbi:MAG TPA: helix-turn-helix transcriptional regulator [Candidatus Lustribacter sp.]|nr:helix-turn-helix transcriptional regulator [Candidatus Lustribacter sp.]